MRLPIQLSQFGGEAAKLVCNNRSNGTVTVNSGEACDDNNRAGGGGCSPTCKDEGLKHHTHITLWRSIGRGSIDRQALSIDRSILAFVFRFHLTKQKSFKPHLRVCGLCGGFCHVPGVV